MIGTNMPPALVRAKNASRVNHGSQTPPRFVARRGACAHEQRREFPTVPRPVAGLPLQPELAIDARPAEHAGDRHDVRAGADPAVDAIVRSIAGSATRADGGA